MISHDCELILCHPGSIATARGKVPPPGAFAHPCGNSAQQGTYAFQGYVFKGYRPAILQQDSAQAGATGITYALKRPVQVWQGMY